MRSLCVLAAGCGAPIYFPVEPSPRVADDTAVGDSGGGGLVGDSSATTPTPGPTCSVSGGASATLVVRDVGPSPLDLFWRDGYCAEWPIAPMNPGDEVGQYTYFGHVFVVRDLAGELVDTLVIDQSSIVWEVR